MTELDFILRVESAANLEFLSKFSSELYEYLPNIETLALHGYFSNLNFDNLINLRKLHLFCYFLDDFNFDSLFKSICNQLEEIVIVCTNINDTFLAKLFYSHNFPYLHKLIISKTMITKLEKKFFDRFPMLQTFSAYENKQLAKIDDNAFSQLKHLTDLYLHDNCIESIDKSHFSADLTKLKILHLDGNPFKHIREDAFSDLINLQSLSLNNAQLTSLSPKFLVGLNNLKSLSLNNNKLVDFDVVHGILDHLKQIKEIDISGNSFKKVYLIWYPFVTRKAVSIKYC